MNHTQQLDTSYTRYRNRWKDKDRHTRTPLHTCRSSIDCCDTQQVVSSEQIDCSSSVSDSISHAWVSGVATSWFQVRSTRKPKKSPSKKGVRSQKCRPPPQGVIPLVVVSRGSGWVSAFARKGRNGQARSSISRCYIFEMLSSTRRSWDRRVCSSGLRLRCFFFITIHEGVDSNVVSGC